MLECDPVADDAVGHGSAQGTGLPIEMGAQGKPKDMLEAGEAEPAGGGLLGPAEKDPARLVEGAFEP